MEEMLIPDKEFWVTKSGERIRYTDLTNRHLNNIAFMLQEKLIEWTNMCMSHNEEMDPPQWLMDTIDAVNHELNRRYS